MYRKWSNLHGFVHHLLHGINCAILCRCIAPSSSDRMLMSPQFGAPSHLLYACRSAELHSQLELGPLSQIWYLQTVW